MSTRFQLCQVAARDSFLFQLRFAGFLHFCYAVKKVPFHGGADDELYVVETLRCSSFETARPASYCRTVLCAGRLHSEYCARTNYSYSASLAHGFAAGPANSISRGPLVLKSEGLLLRVSSLRITAA